MASPVSARNVARWDLAGLMQELLEYLKAADGQREMEHWLALRHLADPLNDPQFALNPWTTRLRPPDPKQHPVVADTRPLALLLSVPDLPWTAVVDTASDEVWGWLQTMGSQGYPPFPNFPPFFQGGYRPRAMPNGLIVEEDRVGSGPEVDSYFAVERSGVLQLGLTQRAHGFPSQAPDRICFKLTPLVGYVRQFLEVTHALYAYLPQSRPFALFVNLRGTQGAGLGAFAQNLQAQHPVSCWMPNLQFRYPAIGASSDFNAVARQVAVDLCNAWGQRHLLCYIQGDAAKGLDGRVFNDCY